MSGEFTLALAFATGIFGSFHYAWPGQLVTG